MDALPTELLALAPLALAAGVDLYLTLLLLGAAPTLPWWSPPRPGALGDLDSPGIVLVVGAFYLLELAAERYAPAALVWNTFHAVIRPVAGALLALLLLEGQPLPVMAGGALLAGALASLAHAVRSGAQVLRFLGAATLPHVLLVSLLEDAVVLGLVTLALDAPVWGTAVSGALVATAALLAPSLVRAFRFAAHLAAGRAFQTLGRRRWMSPEEMPDWVRRVLAGDALAPGGGLRGCPAGAHRLPGAPRFVLGWVVVRGSSPLLVFRGPRGTRAVDLGSLAAVRVGETAFFRRVDLRTPAGGAARVYFQTDGPSEASLEAEFLVAGDRGNPPPEPAYG
ncbi:MAG TPA: DUF4126 family protein [Longimicrobiales bacterium]|nr:DUF4126 family protein [Longimicrobiales bacterium]